MSSSQSKNQAHVDALHAKKRLILQQISQRQVRANNNHIIANVSDLSAQLSAIDRELKSLNRTEDKASAKEPNQIPGFLNPLGIDYSGKGIRSDGYTNNQQGNQKRISTGVIRPKELPDELPLDPAKSFVENVRDMAHRTETSEKVSKEKFHKWRSQPAQGFKKVHGGYEKTTRLPHSGKSVTFTYKVIPSNGQFHDDIAQQDHKLTHLRHSEAPDGRFEGFENPFPQSDWELQGQTIRSDRAFYAKPKDEDDTLATWFGVPGSYVRQHRHQFIGRMMGAQEMKRRGMSDEEIGRELRDNSRDWNEFEQNFGILNSFNPAAQYSDIREQADKDGWGKTLLDAGKNQLKQFDIFGLTDDDGISREEMARRGLGALMSIMALKSGYHGLKEKLGSSGIEGTIQSSNWRSVQEKIADGWGEHAKDYGVPELDRQTAKQKQTEMEAGLREGKPHPDVLEQMVGKADNSAVREAQPHRINKKIGPVRDKLAPEDIFQYRRPDGSIRTVVVHADIAGADPYITQDGTRIPQGGGPDLGNTDANYGRVAFGSEGLHSDKQILKHLPETGGLAVTVGARPQTSLTSNHGTFNYMGEVRSSIRMQKISSKHARDVLAEVFSRCGLKIPGSVDEAEHILVGATFAERERVFKLLGSKSYTKALGIPARAEIIQNMNSPHYSHLPHGRVLAAMHLEPESGPAELFGVPRHPAYSILNKGQFLGRFANPMKLSELAPEDFADWIELERIKHERFMNMSAWEQDNIIANILANPKDRQKVLRAYDMRSSQPKEHNWLRSIQFSKKSVRLNERAIRSAIEGP